MLKLAKNQANAKQHPDSELLLFENYLHSSSTFLSNRPRSRHESKYIKYKKCLNMMMFICTKQQLSNI